MNVSFAVLLLLVSYAKPIAGEATWYGNEFLGEHHAAYWHGEVPEFAPDVVDETYFGIASNDFEFGTILKISTEDHTAFGVVVDRMACWVEPYHIDLWPALAKELGFGPSFEEDAGRVIVQIEVVSLPTGYAFFIPSPWSFMHAEESSAGSY